MAKTFPTYFIAIFVLWSCIAFRKSYAKPTELEIGPDPASSIAIAEPTDEDASLLRDQRSPQYGFNDYDDYFDGGSPRHLKNKRKHHKPIYVPIGILGGGHGCRGYRHGCGGSHHKPSYGGYGGQQSSASAAAASFGTGNYGGSSQAQAASLSFGPFSFSAAQAQSSSGRDYSGFDY